MIRDGLSSLSKGIEELISEIFASVISPTSMHGKVKFSLADEQFSSQPSIALLPKLFAISFSAVLSGCCLGLSETSRTIMLELMADAVSRQLDVFLRQVCGWH